MAVDDTLESSLALLLAGGIPLDPGLTSREFEAVEQRWGFRFPDDLRALLARALPRGDRMPNWREPSSDAICGQMQWPLDGLLFDVEHDNFWVPAWGPRPAALLDALARATEQFRAIPKLVPIYGHRYIPAEPCDAGNPVISVHQMDVIYYGRTLHDYISCEFGGLEWKEAIAGQPRRITFWTDVVDGLYERLV